jgi:hypothetical protein
MKQFFFITLISILNIIELRGQIVPNNFDLNTNHKNLNKINISNPLSNTITDIITVGDTIWLGTSRGVSVSYDGGENWTNFYNSQTFGDNGVSAISYNKYDGSVWVAIAGDVEVAGGAILPEGRGFKYTYDGGLTWVSIDKPIDNPDDSSLVYGINDGVNLPKVRAIPITTGINNVTYDIAFTKGMVWITSYAGGLRRSADKGHSWQRVLLPSDELSKITPNDTIRFALQPVAGKFGPDDHLNHRLFSVIAINDSTVFAGSAGGINKSSNAEDQFPSWIKFNHTNQDNPISGNWVVAFAYNKNLHRLWAGTRKAEDSLEYSGVSSTSDGGKNWETFLKGEDRSWNLTTKGNDIIAALDNGIFRSSNEGATWLKPNNIIDKNTGVALTTKTFYSAAASEGNGFWDVWLGSDDGLAKIRETSGIMWEGEWKIFIASQNLGNLNESYCYPNPFSPRLGKLKIKFGTGGKDENVTIRIFDFAFNYVRTVLQNVTRNRDLESPPEFWDGKDDNGNYVSNGVYFYRIELGDNDPIFGKILVVQ